jgi:membrane associated rhomboid family serine protease
MIIPMGTDAPIYYWPRATVALIVLNVAMLFVVPPPGLFGRETHVEAENPDAVVEAVVTNFDRYALALGDGLHPVQWLTHNFLHYGIMHLAGNMLFLWSFGIVVEGKLGPLKYLATVLLMGTLHGALVQTLLLRSGLEGHAAGASAVVYGLLAVCMVWAPRNELNCLVIFLVGFRTYVFNWDLRYTTVALLYLGEQVLGMGLMGFTGRVAVSEMGHLSGAFWGAVLAVVILKAGWVDCEGWDMFSLLSKNRRLARDWKKRGELLDQGKRASKKRAKADAAPAAEKSPAERSAAAVGRVRSMIDTGDLAGALAAYDKSARSLVRWPSQPDLYALIKAMHAQKAEADSVRLMRDHCRYYPEESSRMRLKLAHVLIRDRQRPAEALRVLADVPLGSLSPDLESTRRKLVRQAEQMQEDGVLELEEDV